jgi:hypothetical protein
MGMAKAKTANPWETEDRQSTSDHWAHLTIVDRWREPSYLTNQLTGEKYVADSHGGPWMWRLRCDCGYEFEIEATAFPGRRVARNCARTECPYTSRQEPEAIAGRPVGTSGAVFTVYLPNDVINLIHAHRKIKLVSFSKAITQLIRKVGIYELLEKD